MKYEIKGAPFPVVICTVDPGESLICESGAMAWMSSNMKQDTQLAGKGKGLLGGLAKAAGSMFTGEGIFRDKYTAEGKEGMIAFGSNVPGRIMAVEIKPGMSIVAQKGAYLASTEGVEMSVKFQKKMSGIFGGEGIIMQQFSGDGIVLLEIDGETVEYELAAGEKMYVSTGYVALMDESVTMEAEIVKGIKNIAFGGEGLVNTTVTGPGKVVLQTMPVSALARAVIPYVPTSSSNS